MAWLDGVYICKNRKCFRFNAQNFIEGNWPLGLRCPACKETMQAVVSKPSKSRPAPK
jgi:transcription initiation factor IIE alpha subunit